MSRFGTERQQAFSDWVAADMPDEASVPVYYEVVKWPADQLLSQMSSCTDTMPEALRERLDMPPRASYASAAKHLLDLRSAAVG
jgi:hypothetical protein